MTVNLKGFDWDGKAWSWPEYDYLTGALTRPAHALAGEMTACGESWPHGWDARGPLRSPAPGEAPGGIHELAPTQAQIARIHADPPAVLCPRCCATLGIVHHQAGQVGELP